MRHLSASRKLSSYCKAVKRMRLSDRPGYQLYAGSLDESGTPYGIRVYASVLWRLAVVDERQLQIYEEVWAG